MAGGGDRQKFRDALDHAENHRPDRIGNHDGVRNLRERPGSSRLFACAPQCQQSPRPLNVEGVAWPTTRWIVMRGLDPRIHPPSQESFRSRWMAGSTAMT